MQREQVWAGQRSGRTRYVFGAAPEREATGATKVCPRCGEELFADMDRCYGCLYDFSLEEPPVRSASVHDPLETVELDEIDEDLVIAPRHRKGRAPSTDDTIVEPLVGLGAPAMPDEAGEGPEGAYVLVRSPGIEVRLPLPARGLCVGRGEANDVILRSRSVSRSHVRLTPVKGGVVAQDLGATNPATVQGVALEGSMTLAVGDEVVVCGTTFVIAE